MSVSSSGLNSSGSATTLVNRHGASGISGTTRRYGFPAARIETHVPPGFIVEKCHSDFLSCSDISGRSNDWPSYIGSRSFSICADCSLILEVSIRISRILGSI